MGHAPNQRWLYVREMLLALAVLGLLALNFGPPAPAAAGELAVSSTSWCGQPLSPDAGGHPPCHACRADAVALPPPPVAVLPVLFALDAPAFAPFILASPPGTRSLAAAPRGPPVSV
jgi:hypothetical protein